VAVTVRVEAFPLMMLVGSAVMVTVGVGPVAFTLTVTLAELLPLVPVATAV
jgi:hypothetical protein